MIQSADIAVKLITVKRAIFNHIIKLEILVGDYKSPPT